MEKLIPENVAYIIIGVVKCGTTSLEKWMKQEGYNVLREESLFKEGDVGSSFSYGDGLERYKRNHRARKPILVLRDPIKRIFSHYHYKQNHQSGDIYEIHEKTLDEALENHPELLNASNYEKYLKKWSEVNPIIVYFEDLIKLDGFPHETKCDCGVKMTDEEEKLIRLKINYKIHSKYI